MDIFSQIAKNAKIVAQEKLVPILPEKLEEIEVVLSDNSEGSFVPYKKMDSKEELYAQLKKLRADMREFLKDYTPDYEQTETTIPITKFQYSLNGGEKKEIQIPHYGGPIGRHTAEYTTEISLEKVLNKRIILCFDGVDYIAKVFVNGEFVGSHEGFFAPFEFDITDQVHTGKNTIKVVVENDFVMMGNHLDGECDDAILTDGDKIYAATGLGWDDYKLGWHHCPPGFGIYNKVYVQYRNEEYITDIFPRVNSQASEIWVECMGATVQEKKVSFLVSIYGQNFQETVFENMQTIPTLGQYGVQTGDEDKQLKIANGYNRFILPVEISNRKIWTPETPYLYQVRISMVIDGEIVSTQKCQFGIRDFVQNEDSEPKGKFFLNGEEIRLFGANTMGFEQQDVYRGDLDQLIDDILLAKICNMNFLRITQRPVQKEIYEYCDRLGMMIQTDMPAFATIRINQYCEFLRQTEEMEKLVRSHPCCVLDTYINEPCRFLNGKPHRAINKIEMMGLFEAADNVVRLNNPDRVVKHVDGDYHPPRMGMTDTHCYTLWYNGHVLPVNKLHKGYWCHSREGWHVGCGEFGAEGLDYYEIMKEYYPKHWMEEPFNPQNIIGAQTWDFHHFFYETPESPEEWVKQSHKHQEFAAKIMTSSFRRNMSMNTFAIHLFIDAFPAGWMKTIMDFKRNPKPAYFAYRDCLSPIFCSFRSDRFTFTEKESVRIESYLNVEKGVVDELRYMVEYEGRCIYSAAKQPEDKVFQGYVAFRMPEVSERSQIKVYMGAFCRGELLHYACEEYEVFPEIEVQEIEMISYDDYTEDKQSYDERINNGEKIIFQPLLPGEYVICGKQILVRRCFRGDQYFVSRDTNHPLADDFRPNDFKYFYDSQADMLSPIISATAYCEDAELIIKCGNVNGTENEKNIWRDEMGIGEIKVGKGSIILNQLLLDNKEKNPIIRQLMHNISKHIED